MVARGRELKKEVEGEFRDKFHGETWLHRILVHVPDFVASPGGFRPTCLMTSDAAAFLERIDWSAVRSSAPIPRCISLSTML